MRWLVEAADTKTGEDTEITVEAMTEAEAEILARYNGLLVSKVYKAGKKKVDAPVVPYAKPEVIEAAPPDFSRLVGRARSTRRLGVALSVLGWFAVACGVGIFGYVALRNGWGNWRAWLPAATGSAAWQVALVGVAAIAAGSALQLLASMALVLRIAARQGQAQRPARPVEAARVETVAA